MDSISANIEQKVFMVPDCLKIDQLKYGLGLISKKKYNTNDYIYSASCFIVPNDNNKYNLNLKINEKIKKYEVDGVNSVKINDNYRIFYTFDGFMNHSCDPNTKSDNCITL